MEQQDLIKIWDEFTKHNDFMLNPDNEFVQAVAFGVLENEKKNGMKQCPCRLRDGTRERDLELLCPCNFKSQEVWHTQERCWCGLFVKRN